MCPAMHRKAVAAHGPHRVFSRRQQCPDACRRACRRECRYLGSLGAEEKLYRHVTTGRKARFPDGHEEDHPIVKTSDPDRIANLVNWILSLK